MSRPQHHKAVRLRLASAALGLGAALALTTGCSAGQSTETETQVAAVNGATGNADGIAVRNARLDFPAQGRTYPAGSSAPMKAVLANDSDQADRLVEVRSSYAKSARISGETSLPGDTGLRAYGESGAAQQPSGQVPPPEVDLREVGITLQGLTQEIGPGVTIPVTFVFEKAGEVKVQVPIGTDPHPRPAGETGGH